MSSVKFAFELLDTQQNAFATMLRGRSDRLATVGSHVNISWLFRTVVDTGLHLHVVWKEIVRAHNVAKVHQKPPYQIVDIT